MEKYRKKIYIYLISTILLVGISSFFSYKNNLHTQPEYAHRLLQQRFLEKHEQLKLYTQELLNNPINDVHQLLKFCKKRNITNSEYAFYIYDNEVLTAWSSNVVQMPSEIDDKTQRIKGFQQKERKQFFVYQQQSGKRHIIGIYMLEYPFQQQANAYINSPLKRDVHLQTEISHYPISDAQGHTIFHLNINDCVHESDITALIELLLWMSTCTVFLLLLQSLSYSLEFLRRRQNLTCLLLCLIATALAHICLCAQVPHALFTSKLFSSIYYSSAFKSLGGLFLGCYTLLIIAILIVKRFNPKVSHLRKIVVFGNLSISNMLYILIFAAFYQMVLNASMQVLPTLPIKDNLNTGQPIFVLKLIFAFSLSSIICSIQLLQKKFCNCCFEILSNRKQFVWISIASTTLILIVYLLLIFQWFGKQEHLFWIIGSIVYLCISGINILHTLLSQDRFSIHYHVLYCLLTVLLFIFLLEDTNQKRMQFSKESFASSILEKKNPLLLHNLDEVGNLIETDEHLYQLLLDSNVKRNEVVDYLEEQYLLPYLDKYRKKIYVGRSCIPTDCLRIRKYQQIISTNADSIYGNNISPLKANPFGKTWFLLFKQLPITQAKKGSDTVFIAIEAYSGTDFFKPNYLLNREAHHLEDEVSKLSCAEYVNGRLHEVLDMENAFYLDIQSYHLDTLYSGMTFCKGFHEYYVYFQHPEHMVMIATPKTLLKKSMATFPYLFLLTLIQYILLSVLINYRYHVRHLLFKQRIQILIVFVILLTAVVGCILFSIFSKKFSQNELYKSTHSRMDMLTQLLPCEKLSPDSCTTVYLEQHLLPTLYRIPNEYVENVNLYTLKGDAVVTLDKHLPIPQNMDRLNPQVVENIFYQQKNFYRDVHIMKSNAQASILYKPLLNEHGEIVAYLSFPTRQRGGYMEQLVASVLPTFFGIYLIISILFAILGTLLSKHLVASLTRIATHLSQVKLRSKNQKIEWKYEDEIGCLIKDYNRLVDNLEISAKQLANSERELAWKELAQQVAHEIKNPLTPMRLNTQQLQRRLNEGKLNHEQLEKYIQMMVWQIDALTEIASSISFLTKIPQGKGRVENLREILETAIITFENEEGCCIEWKSTAPNEMPIWIDKEQLLRVFNNLIKNAIQAKKEDCDQKIEIRLQAETENFWTLSITDYGKGMNEEEKAKAFIPHFTTKSTGSGLGLAIVKNILNNWGGSIQVESILNNHTTFYIKLPAYHKKSLP